jgi:hypothetical protein
MVEKVAGECLQEAFKVEQEVLDLKEVVKVDKHN